MIFKHIQYFILTNLIVSKNFFTVSNALCNEKPVKKYYLIDDKVLTLVHVHNYPRISNQLGYDYTRRKGESKGNFLLS